MPTFGEQYPGGVAKFAAAIRRLQREVDALRQRPFAIPVLDDDPPAGDPTNLWLLNDGRLRARDAEGRVREWVPTVNERPQIPTFASNPAVSTGWRMWLDGNGNFKVRQANDAVRTFAPTTTNASGDGGTGSQGGGTTDDPKPPQSQPKTYTKTYVANASETYRGNGAQRGATPLYYGRYDSTNGQQKAWIGFNDSLIRSDLSGSVIRKVEFFMANSHAFLNSGVDVRLVGHNNGSKPADYGDVNVVGYVWAVRHWGKPQAKWVTLPDSFGIRLRDNDIKGVLINQASDSIVRYGFAKGVGSGNPPKLRITYTK